jgi:PAS domain-containing protein
VQRWFTVRITRFQDGSGNVVVAHENITARKQAELREAVHSQTMTLMARDASLDEILDALVRGVENSHPGMVASVQVLNAGGTHVQLVAAPSLPPAWRHAISGLAVAPHGPIVAAFSGEQRLASDIENDPGWAEWRELAACAGLVACWSEPIRGSSGLVLGSFSLYPRQIRSPGNTELAAITAATQLAAVAIEHARAQEKLHTSAHLLDASQQIARMGGWELDVDTRSLYWSEGLYRIHDTSPAEFNPDFEVGISYFPPDSRRIIDAALKVAIETGQGYDLELEKITFKGRRIHVRTTCVVTMRDGRAVKLTGVMQDITEQKQAEAARLELSRSCARRSGSIAGHAGRRHRSRFQQHPGRHHGQRGARRGTYCTRPGKPGRIGRSSVRAGNDTRSGVQPPAGFNGQPTAAAGDRGDGPAAARPAASVHFDLPPVPEALCAH